MRGLRFVDDSEHLVHHVNGVLPHMDLNLLLVLVLVWGLGRHFGLVVLSVIGWCKLGWWWLALTCAAHQWSQPRSPGH